MRAIPLAPRSHTSQLQRLRGDLLGLRLHTICLYRQFGLKDVEEEDTFSPPPRPPSRSRARSPLNLVAGRFRELAEHDQLIERATSHCDDATDSVGGRIAAAEWV